MPPRNLVVLPVRTDPTVSFRIWFKVGSQNDPPGKEGLASVTASMLTEASTRTHTYGQILDALFPLAAGYSASVSAEMTVIEGRTHRDNLKEYYPLLHEAILEPAFQHDDLDRIKSQALNYLENTLRYASDEELGKAVLDHTLYAGTPYGHIPAGLIQSVTNITIDDVRAFYRKYYTRRNVVAGLGGGYDGALAASLSSDLGALPPGTVAAPAIRAPRVKGFHVTIIEKDAASTAISMGVPIDVLRGDTDWYPLAVANSWFGEHRNSSSHLYQVIREARGLNYGDYSYIESFPHGGMLTMPPVNVGRRRQMFEIWIRPVPNEARHFALRAALREFQHLAARGLTAQEFELTRSFLRKYILHYAPTTMRRLGYALDDRFYGIKDGHLAVFGKRLDAMTLADVNRAIRKHLRYGDMQIVIVTSGAQALKEALVKDVPSPISYATPKPEHVMAEDASISTFPLRISAEHVNVIPVAELFLR